MSETKGIHFKFIIAPSVIAINVGYVLQKFNSSGPWMLGRQDIWSALWVEILQSEIVGRRADTNNTGGETWSASSGWWLLSNMFDRANWLLLCSSAPVLHLCARSSGLIIPAGPKIRAQCLDWEPIQRLNTLLLGEECKMYPNLMHIEDVWTECYPAVD